MKTSYANEIRWFNVNELEDCMGYIQKCKSCEWLGKNQSQPQDSCPQCGSELEPDELLVLGGVLLVWKGRNIFFYGIRSNANLRYTYVEHADINDVIKFMARHNT